MVQPLFLEVRNLPLSALAFFFSTQILTVLRNRKFNNQLQSFNDAEKSFTHWETHVHIVILELLMKNLDRMVDEFFDQNCFYNYLMLQ